MSEPGERKIIEEISSAKVEQAQIQEIFDVNSQEITKVEAHEDEVERMKEFQSDLLREWAKSQNDPMVEGEDFMIPKIEDYESAENISPHETTNVYFMFKKERFGALRDFFEKEYSGKMEKFNKWEKETKINYSWAGRFCVEGAGGTAIDTGPVESVKPMVCETHHQEFKDFFRQEAGFDLPTPEQLDEILGEMADSLDWYNKVLAELKSRISQEENKQKTGEESEAWKYRKYEQNLEYVVKILKDAQLEKLKKQIGAGDVEKGSRKLIELPERIDEENGGIKLGEKVRHYNDLTYNADDFQDLDEMCKLLGDGFTPPTEKGARSDRIYEDNFGFDRKKIEDICRKFSEKLFGK